MVYKHLGRQTFKDPTVLEGLEGSNTLFRVPRKALLHEVKEAFA